MRVKRILDENNSDAKEDPSKKGKHEGLYADGKCRVR